MLLGCGVGLPFEACAVTAQTTSSLGSDALTRTILSCGARATSCDALARCTGAGRGLDFCVAHPRGACDGDVLVTCRGTPLPMAIDCARWSGGTCGTLNGRLACLNPSMCAANATPRCEGNTLVSCTGMPAFGGLRLQAIECGHALPGGRCMRVGAAGTPSCVPSDLPPCDSVATRCDGSTAVWCLSAQGDDSGLTWQFDRPREVRIDCASMNQRCEVARETGQALCAAAAEDCTSGETRCDGGELRTCVAGRWETVDCTAIGFVGCAGGACR